MSVTLRDMIGPYCCLCFETPPAGVDHRDWLEPVSDEPGRVWDVCHTCAAREKARGVAY